MEMWWIGATLPAWQLLAFLALAFFTSADFATGPLFFYLATIGFCGSLVFYNAYLPQLAAPT